MGVYVVKAMGIKQVQTKFTRMGEARLHTTPLMETVAEMMMGIIEQTFNSEGRRGGGSWKQDTVEWAGRKMRDNLDMRIGHATLALRDSVTIRDADHQDLKVGHDFVSLGSLLPYAATQQRNRPFIKFTANDKLRIRGMVRDYLIGAFRAG